MILTVVIIKPIIVSINLKMIQKNSLVIALVIPLTKKIRIKLIIITVVSIIIVMKNLKIYNKINKLNLQNKKKV